LDYLLVSESVEQLQKAYLNQQVAVEKEGKQAEDKT